MAGVAEKDLNNIFNRLKRLLKKYDKPLESKSDLEGNYDLWSFKEVEIAGRKRREVFFASIIIRSKYVGLYYMPVYTDPPVKEVLKPDLLELLKGKSCFHIKQLDTNLEGQIKDALEIGFRLYKKRGWI